MEGPPRLENLDRAAMRVTQEAGRRAGYRLVAILGHDRGEASLDLGLHEQRALMVAEVARPRQHLRQPGYVAHLSGPALALDMQQVRSRDALVAQPNGTTGQHPGCAGMQPVQPVADGLLGLAERNAWRRGR